MRLRLLATSTVAFLALAVACAQDSNPEPSPGQNSSSMGTGGGQRGGRGGWGGGMMGAGRGVLGTITETTPDHYSIKTEAGEIYVVHYSVNTRLMKGGPQRRGERQNDAAPEPPQTIKPADIKVGDIIAASGEIDPATKSVGAVVIFQIDPERARQMREMQANYGKTWLMGKVAAINDLKISLQGGPDNATHVFAADENTTFRKRRDPITLADVQVGDMVRVEGSVREGIFTATTVAVMGVPQGGNPPRSNETTPPQ